MVDMDWKNGRWTDGKSSGNKKVVITGDWVPCWDLKSESQYDPVMAERPEACYGGTLAVLKRADLRIANLECAVVGDEAPILKSGPHLCARERHLPCLAAGGFDAVTLANNHVFDYGEAGFRHTRAALDKLGIKHFGAGLDDAEAWRPLVCDAGGLRVGFVAFTEGHDLSAAAPGKPGVAGWDVERARASVRELKKSCDAVIVIPHGGIEYAAHPADYCVEAYHELAAEHPAAIVAHHPHVPQGIEFHDGVPIFYSLGNYLFHLMTPLCWRRHGYMVELELDCKGVHGFALHPYFVGDDGLEVLEGEKHDRFFATLREASRPFDPGEDPYSGFHATLKYRWHNLPFAQFEAVAKHFKDAPVKAAAMLRSRLTTLQNQRLHVNMYDRVVRGTIDDAPDRAVELEREYMTREL